MRNLDDCDVGFLAVFLHYRGDPETRGRLGSELPTLATKLAAGHRLDTCEKALLTRFVIHRGHILTLARLKVELPEVFNRLTGRVAVKAVNVCFSCLQAPCACPDFTHAEA